MAVSRVDKTITLNYDSPLDAANLPAISAFSVTTSGAPNPVTGVSVTGNQVKLTLANAFAAGSVGVTYTDPTAANDALATQDIAGNDAAGFSSGTLADGYIRNATVYIDTNRNGVADSGVDYLVGTTDKLGNFFLPSGAPSGTLIAVGGVNIDTGLPNTVALKAPAGSTTINPLTTLVQAVVEASIVPVNVNDAANQVASALGLNLQQGLNLTTYDPIASGNLSVQQAAAQVATVLITAAKSTGGATAVDSAVTQLATVVQNAVTNTSTLDLTDHATLASVLGDSNLAGSVATVNTGIASANSIAEVSAVQQQAFDTIAPNAPTLTAPDHPTNAPSVNVSLNTSAIDGSAAVAGDTVTVFEGSNPVGSRQLTQDDILAGHVAIDLALTGDGSHSLTALIKDAANNASQHSAAVSVVVDRTPPAAAEITGFSDNSGSASDTVTNDRTLTLTITVSPGANAGISLFRRAISSCSRVWIRFMISYLTIMDALH